jgi:tRNA(fMet)-specific endonuclease VapC
MLILQQLKAAKVRVGTMDLKIASITLTNDATLLSRNLADYERVPNLKVLDWLS